MFTSTNAPFFSIKTAIAQILVKHFGFSGCLVMLAIFLGAFLTVPTEASHLAFAAQCATIILLWIIGKLNKKS